MFGLKPARLSLLFLVLLVLCTIATFTFEDRLVKAAVNHLGALAIVGLLACLTGYIAYRKKRNQKKAFLLSVLLSVILGAIAVLLVYLSTGIVYCGGGVVRLAALTIVVVYLVFPRVDGARV